MLRFTIFTTQMKKNIAVSFLATYSPRSATNQSTVGDAQCLNGFVLQSVAEQIRT